MQNIQENETDCISWLSKDIKSHDSKKIRTSFKMEQCQRMILQNKQKSKFIMSGFKKNA